MKRLILGGLFILIITGALALAMHARTVAQRHAFLQEMAMEVGSIAEIRHPYVVPNHAGTRFLINIDAENGAAAYLYDTVSGVKKLLFEEDQKGYDWRQYKLLGWSPGDGFLAYGDQAAPKQTPQDSVPGDLFIADGTSGKTLTKIRVAPDSTNTLSQFTWLSSNSFAYLNGHQDLISYEQKPQGWIQTKCFTNATGGNLHEAQTLDAISSNSVTFRMRRAIWTFDLTSGVLDKSWGSYTNTSATNTLIGSFFSPETGKYLLPCTNSFGWCLYTFDPVTRKLGEFAHPPPYKPLSAPVWINHGTGYAFLKSEAGLASFFIATNASAEPVQMFRRGEVRLFTVNDDHIYIAGTLTNEPPSIWDYNSASGALRCLLSPATRGLEHTECVPFECIPITNAAGEQFSYHIWKPAHFDSSKKYPLVLGNSPYSWTPFPMAAANAGYYFVTVDRTWWGAPLDDWGEKTMTVYHALAKTPNMDTNRVYLCARSVESSEEATLYSQNPQQWRGLIFFDPIAQLPDLPISNPPRIFIASGEFEETNALNNVLEFQKKASDAGVPITVTILRGARHVSYGIAPQQQRVPAFVKFLSED